MPEKQIFTRYKDHDIRVENTWLSGARLYINNKCVDETDKFLAVEPNTPLLTAEIMTDDGIETIDILMLAILTVKIQIHANGKLISGEKF